MRAAQHPTDEKPDLHDFSGRIVLVGAGKMGGALLEGWLWFGLDPQKVAVIEPSPAPQISALAARGVEINPDVQTLGQVAAVVIAVKPQIAVQVMPALKPIVAPTTVVVSIMAGKTLQFLAATLSAPCALVRAMPNTPAAIGRGITVAVPMNAGTAQRDLAHRLLAATGSVEWIADEALMDAVTAVSAPDPLTSFSWPKRSPRPGRRPACRRRSRKGSRARPWRAPANCCTVPTSTPQPCGRTSLRRAARPRRRSTC